MDKSTKRPWHVEDRTPGNIADGIEPSGWVEIGAADDSPYPNGAFFMRDYETNLANAELAVRAVNAHDSLVAALAAVLPEMRREHDAGDGHFSTAEVEACEAALAKARGEQ